MKKFKFTIYKILIFFVLLNCSAFSKPLPPGSGTGDVPANILIMLDVSGSMSEQIIKGTGLKRPQSIDVDPATGNIFGLQYAMDGIKKIQWSDGQVDTTFGVNGVTDHNSWGVDCFTYYPREVKYYAPTSSVFYVSYYGNTLSEISSEDGSCKNEWDFPSGWPNSSYIQQLEIKNDILYAPHRQGFFVYDLTAKQEISCTYNNAFRDRIGYGQDILIDDALEYMYVAYSDTIYVYELEASGCPSNTVFAEWSTTSWGWPYIESIDFHPSDPTIMYMTTGWGGRLKKYSIDSTTKVGTLASGTNEVGTWCDDAATPSQICLQQATGMVVDNTNNRILVTDGRLASVIAFDFDLNLISLGDDPDVYVYGGTLGSRMDGAKTAIKSILDDSSLLNAANYGFAVWSYTGWGGSSIDYGYDGWDDKGTASTTDDEAIPCNNDNCLNVRISDNGAAEIKAMIDGVSPISGTDAITWATIADEYYNGTHHSDSPLDENLDCQNSYIIVIGDGSWSSHNAAKDIVEDMFASSTRKIKTFTIAYGGGIDSWGLTNFDNMAIAGGTNGAIVADNPDDLTTTLKARISQIIAEKLSFTAPAISATLDEGGYIYQAQFEYQQNMQWDGTIFKKQLLADGTVVADDADPPPVGNWSAEDSMPEPDSRNIWTAFEGQFSSENGKNNFTRANVSAINSLFMKTGNVVGDYHRETATAGGNTLNMRCFGHANLDVTIGDGNTDDQLGLIDFIRGKDYFDYNGDCSLNETRSKTLGDIYNSEIVIVGAPQAETAFVSLNQESYWRSIKGYDTWKNDSLRVDRQKVVYAGGNDGMLHAFDDETGAELWAFVPPFIASKLPTMMAPGLNLSTGGGSAAIFGVDGSITAHDMYFQELQDDGSGNMELAAANWHTILVVPYGRGGAGFSVLNITDPNNPFHKYSIFNDITNNRILHLGQDGKFNEYPYFPRAYALNAFTETIQATINKNAGNGTTACDDTPFTGGNYCYQGHDLTMPNRSLSASDVTVLLNGIETTSFTATLNSGDTVFSFADQITYNADPAATQDFSSQLVIKINPGVGSFGLGANIPYDYSTLGETWSSPRIFRIPNLGAGDEDIEDDKYVAVMGGGYGSYNPGIGTSVFVVDLVDPIAPGSVLKEIAIDDRGESDIVNSIPNSPVVVTADTATGINFSGALVYINDFEGKVTKINLTNMENDGTEEENAIALYDTTTLFWSDSSSANGRYMYHSMDATIGASTNQLWLFGGTGNIDRINSNDATVSNIMFGIRDENYPNYKNIIEPEIITARNLALCNNTTDDIDGSLCPESADLGWYITLPNFGKVTNEPTVSKGYVYFPVYEPTTSVNLCDLGNAYLCATDDECGTNNSSLIGDLADPSDKCWYAGTGVVSKVVTFGDKIFANISGETSAKGDLISAEGLASDTSGYRSTWSENY